MFPTYVQDNFCPLYIFNDKSICLSFNMILQCFQWKHQKLCESHLVRFSHLFNIYHGESREPASSEKLFEGCVVRFDFILKLNSYAFLDQSCRWKIKKAISFFMLIRPYRRRQESVYKWLYWAGQQQSRTPSLELNWRIKIRRKLHIWNFRLFTGVITQNMAKV